MVLKNASNPVINLYPLGFQWKTPDPFLFCVHHLDLYPAANNLMEPAASLSGRNIGNDFTPKDGWRMYHGQKIPGFPVHPHRGFETITIVLQGFVDHADSAGCAGRYGMGDVQWMTAGSGLQHSEMFALLNTESENTSELFQIWLNLPSKNKFASPSYTMHWSENIPVINEVDIKGKTTQIKIIAGKFSGTSAATPPPDSWASDPGNEVAIWIIDMEATAEFVLPPSESRDEINRTLYFFKGDSIEINDTKIKSYHAIELDHTKEIHIRNDKSDSRFLMLQGKPIVEPVAQYGPFVMNTQEEIRQAFLDYQQTKFGGWPWPRPDQVHPREKRRFALYPNGTSEVK